MVTATEMGNASPLQGCPSFPQHPHSLFLLGTHWPGLLSWSGFFLKHPRLSFPPDIPSIMAPGTPRALPRGNAASQCSCLLGYYELPQLSQVHAGHQVPVSSCVRAHKESSPYGPQRSPCHCTLSLEAAPPTPTTSGRRRKGDSQHSFFLKFSHKNPICFHSQDFFVSLKFWQMG